MQDRGGHSEVMALPLVNSGPEKGHLFPFSGIQTRQEGRFQGAVPICTIK
jgi:hypothetical protein